MEYICGKRYVTERSSERGYTLIEMILVLAIIAILAGVAVSFLQRGVDTARIEETKQEMKTIVRAIAGNPDLVTGGRRLDFGYLGDIGAFPSTLGDLKSNPGGFTTWDGPYLSGELAPSGADTAYLLDAWGQAYVYSGDLTLISTGSGRTITLGLPGTATDYLYNGLELYIRDTDGSLPGNDHKDSVIALLTIPDGSGSYITLGRQPATDGRVRFDSIPIGNHRVAVAFTETGDTLRQAVTVYPGQAGYLEIIHYADIW